MKGFSEYSIKAVEIEDNKYPKILTKIKKPPTKLYYRGKWQRGLFKKSLAVVGARKMTKYGAEVIDRFLASFSTHGVVIVSGFMYGVDTLAHQKALEYGLPTVAVFGCGLDICYPPENKKLYGQILAAGGVALSEYQPNAKPQLWTFPQRNRIVAGLASLGVLVVEAGEKSGSLITAKYAKKFGHSVFAVPGPITSIQSAGTNALIKKGEAKLVTKPEDILGVKLKKKTSLPDLTPKERRIYEELNREPLTVDELALSLGLTVAEVSETLTLMTIAGKITESAGKFYPTTFDKISTVVEK